MTETAEPRPSKLSAILDRVTPQYLSWGLCGLSVVVMVIGTCGAYSIDGPLPPPGPPPPTPESSVVLADRYRPNFYHAILDEDAKRLNLAKVDMDQFRRGLAYRTEFSGEQSLGPGNMLQTSTLKLQIGSRKIWVGEEGRGIRSEHITLKITNTSDKPVAYRITTQAGGRCGRMSSIAHNAIAILPNQTLERAECFLGKASKVRIQKVEILELTPIGYHYVTRLDPMMLLYDERTTEGHQTGMLPVCNSIPWREIKKSMGDGQTVWIDVLDFYARHNCNEYTFFVGYRWNPNGPERIPAVPIGTAARR